MKKAKTKAEREHLARVAAMPCMVNNFECGGRIECHHITGAGMAKKSSDYETIPLCTNHHSAQTPLEFGHAVHKGTRTFEANYGTQQQMLQRTLATLGVK